MAILEDLHDICKYAGEQIVAHGPLVFFCFFFVMPPTSKKLEGHIASGLFVRPSVRHAF